MINVFLTAGQLAIGKGVKVQGVTPAESFSEGSVSHTDRKQPTPIVNGDTIWQVDGQPIGTPEELAAALAAGSSPAKVRIYRVEWMPELEVPRGQLLPGTNSLDQLGISNWSRGRDWRATGFYNHWVTYSEVLQLIASLALGIFLALKQKKNATGVLLLVAVAGLVFALGMTVTRASWVGFAVSAAAMLLLLLHVARSSSSPLVPCHSCSRASCCYSRRRSIGFLDKSDQSTSWRETVWQEGFQLLVSKPRHLIFGVGMDSIKGHWREWGLFDNGRQPIGHMHSNLLQIALERGLPALIVWLILFGVYAAHALAHYIGANGDRRILRAVWRSAHSAARWDSSRAAWSTTTGATPK